MHQPWLSLLGLLYTASISAATPGFAYGRSQPSEPEIRTGDVIAHIRENHGSVSWTDAPHGGQVAYFPDNVWNPAVNAVTRKLKAKRALEETSYNPLDTRELFKRADEISGGLYDGKAQKHAFFSCYNSGQKAYDATMTALSSAGCFALMEGAQALGVRVWVSNSFWTPDHRIAKLFLTWTGRTISAISGGECAYAVSLVTKEFCQLDDKHATQGGKLHMYANPVSSWTKGSETAELKIDPNTCSKDIPCDTPE
ncbi:hypothetical protein MMC16_000855 [Acarospora aff. strigata]|nr:hypothetical protein [Acarospora aff. strigata]